MSFVCAAVFQSTLPQRERRCPHHAARTKAQFQSTLPQRERRLQRIGPGKLTGFQSTLPQRERHFGEAYNFHFFHISIHAPTKGATIMTSFCTICAAISIHAPTKGATGKKPGTGREKQFQSTLPQRERPLAASIFVTCSLFQSTLPQRERRAAIMSFVCAAVFQSTLPQRERPEGTGRDPQEKDYFNPRSHKGSDKSGFPPGSCS